MVWIKILAKQLSNPKVTFLMKPFVRVHLLLRNALSPHSYDTLLCIWYGSLHVYLSWNKTICEICVNLCETHPCSSPSLVTGPAQPLVSPWANIHWKGKKRWREQKKAVGKKGVRWNNMKLQETKRWCHLTQRKRDVV